jgi:hypothetical protein
MTAHTIVIRRLSRAVNFHLIVAIAMCAMTLGCSTAQGPRFMALEPPVEGRSDVYVYRASSLVMMTGAFPLSVDGRAIGPELSNGSYAAMRLAPGRHRLGVDMKYTTGNVALDIDVRANSATFYQLDLSAVPRIGPVAPLLMQAIATSLTHPPLVARPQAQALADLGELKSTHPNGGFLTLERDGAYAAVDDVDAVPGLSATDRDRYREWLKEPHPRAAVIADNGRLFTSTRSTNGLGQVSGGSGTQAAWTMGDCWGSGAKGCQVYAENDRVVWARKP